MITINSNEEANALIKNGVLAIDDDLEIAFDGFSIEADIECNNIYSKGHSRDIDACDINANIINAGDINAGDINAYDIKARNIKARNIDALEIKATNIKSNNIKAANINAYNIDAYNINYYAVCFAHRNIICNSIFGRKENPRHFCIDGEIIIGGEK